MKTLLLHGLICIVYISATEVGVIKTHATDNEKSLESKLRDIKSITNEIHFNNKTETEPKNAIYENWSPWSKCRRCRKTRRRKCISKMCKFSTLYEEKSCGRTRCKRKSRRKFKMNILENVENAKNQKLDLKSWYRLDEDWSNWTPCSQNCTTKRFKFCRKPGKCPKKRIEQHAYCFTEGSRCARWYQNKFDEYDSRVYGNFYSEDYINPASYHYNLWRYINKYTNSMNNKRKLDNYTTTSTTTTTKRPVYKKKRKRQRKCGVMYKNATTGIATNMLRIIGGIETYKSKWPWHVALMNRYKEVFCGGTLISPKWIVTAAHCVRSILYASLNEYDISYDDGTELQYRIIKMFVHPKFNAITIDNDIAMLKLPRTVPMPHACLPVHEPVVGQKCTIMGWGKRKMNDFRGSKRLREAELPIVAKDTCLRSYRRYVITHNMFCAGYRNGGTDTCSGDSGGGLFCPPQKRQGWTVQGITSFGEGCGKRGKYGIYVTIINYLPWIKEIITYN